MGAALVQEAPLLSSTFRVGAEGVGLDFAESRGWRRGQVEEALISGEGWSQRKGRSQKRPLVPHWMIGPCT